MENVSSALADRISFRKLTKSSIPKHQTEISILTFSFDDPLCTKLVTVNQSYMIESSEQIKVPLVLFLPARDTTIS